MQACFSATMACGAVIKGGAPKRGAHAPCLWAGRPPKGFAPREQVALRCNTRSSGTNSAGPFMHGWADGRMRGGAPPCMEPGMHVMACMWGGRAYLKAFGNKKGTVGQDRTGGTSQAPDTHGDHAGCMAVAGLGWGSRRALARAARAHTTPQPPAKASLARATSMDGERGGVTIRREAQRSAVQQRRRASSKHRRLEGRERERQRTSGCRHASHPVRDHGQARKGADHIINIAQNTQCCTAPPGGRIAGLLKPDTDLNPCSQSAGQSMGPKGAAAQRSSKTSLRRVCEHV